MANSPPELRNTAVAIALKLNLKGGDELLLSWVNDPKLDAGSRAAALRLLAHRDKTKVMDLIRQAESDRQDKYRAAVLELASEVNANYAEERGRLVLSQEASIPERQVAFAILAQRKSAAADKVLMQWAERLKHNMVPAELQLDLLEACKTRNTPELLVSVKQFETAFLPTDPLAKWRTALRGGDAERGRTIFVNNSRAQCIRCHKIGAMSGGNAGPELSGATAKKGREHLLESLILPNAKITEGFGSQSLVLENGKVVVGIINRETKIDLVLTTPTGESLTIPLSQIEERTPAKSPMPAMDQILNHRELRDVLEFLSQLP